jgi:site-specific DNA-methyltransferase (adenine-specific)
VLADVVACDAVITDPPYSQRVEDGFRSGSTMKDLQNKPGMGYDPIDEHDAQEIVTALGALCAGWLVVCCDHETFRCHAAAASASGRYSFPPVVIVKSGAAPRMSCDGPASHCEYLSVSRPRTKRFLTWGSLPGWYKMETVRHGHGYVGVSGAKSLALMRALVRDYTRPGDLIVDPFAGSGTTLLAARLEGRCAIGAEIDPKTYALAVKRLSCPYTPRLFADQEDAG